MAKLEEDKKKYKRDVNKDGRHDALDDLNGDGKANKADVKLRQDDLSMDLIGKDYETASRVLSADPSLQQLFQTAIKEGWDERKWSVELPQIDWYKEVGDKYAADAWLAQHLSPEEWDSQIQDARNTVQRQATSLGVQLTEQQLDQFAERYLYEGWGESTRQYRMADALAEFVDGQSGNMLATRDELANLAMQNGVKLDDKFYQDAAQSIIRGESTAADYEKFIRDQAAAAFPLYSDKIKAGMNVRDLASPYISRINEILEIPTDSINLDDMYLRRALGQLDENGDPTYMNLDEFETALRNDPRWETTNNGKNTLLNGAQQMMKDWGFVE